MMTDDPTPAGTGWRRASETQHGGDREDAAGRAGGRRDARADPVRGKARCHHRRARRHRRVRARAPGAASNFLGYHGFPAVICTSPNEVIVHGIPGPYRLAEGDILSVDCGAIIEGYHGDAAYTVGIGTVSAEAERLMDVTERSRGRASTSWSQAAGCTRSARRSSRWPRRRVLGGREYVGHAIGTAMHEQPQVPNYWPGSPGPRSSPAWSSPSSPWSTRWPRDPVPRRPVERCHRRREALGPLRAHHRRHADGPEVLTVP